MMTGSLLLLKHELFFLLDGLETEKVQLETLFRSNIFQSERSSSGVTWTSELKTTVLEDGQMLNVIDTPGLFDSSLATEYVRKEIVTCINLAPNGIHAVLVVLSVSSHFTNEEEAAISTLLGLFGRKICDYVILIFTGGDLLNDDNKTFVLYDNKAKDQTKKENQVWKLLSLVNMVSKRNSSQPYTNEIFTDLKKGTREFEEYTEKFQALTETKQYTEEEISLMTEPMRDELFKRVNEMVESKLQQTTLKLEKLLEEARAARVKAEEKAKAAQKKLDEETREMREELQRAMKRRTQDDQYDVQDQQLQLDRAGVERYELGYAHNISSTMERSSLENNQEFTSPQTLVLVGRKGNGKSATGNTILGTQSAPTFRSERSSSGVTTTCELINTKLKDGQKLNVIDTPGLADSCSENELIVDEIISCKNKDGDGIHAFLLVFSVRSRFSKEEEAAISSLVTFFGEKVYEYLIVVFTGGDILDTDDETLEGFLDDCPKTLKVVNSSLKETTLSLERQLEEERVARAKAEEDARAAKQKLDEEKHCVIVEIRKLQEAES
uniref:Immune-associated nucleotide-binding protein 9-like n=1 Tax=Tanacetum cinerariifolium TaxID=118510 RepID=A0A699H744_TANCI|nr:immune-associated nucleotide-binding protein 9-like [Tanacetum cinerariifolium]